MAMIQCPECGQTVSDKAPTCIHCGAPLAGLNITKIKLFFFNSKTIFLGRSRACDVQIYDGTKLLWSGLAGTTATFELEKPTTLRFHILHCYTGKYYYRDFDIFLNAAPGKKYQMRVTKQAFIDPTRAEFGLAEVEVIDSE
ncbi:MAG: zinc ribbon domain-containing protein [Clostridia bacterium]|nr:zinc ribbon domain-containing protein [Clostridia bacterium]